MVFHNQLELKICIASHTNNPANLRLLQAIERAPIFYAEINPERQNIFISGMGLIKVSDAVYSHTNSVLAQLEFTADRGSYPVGLWERISILPRETLPDPDTQEKLKHWQGYLDVWEKLALEKEYEVDYIEWRYDATNQGVWFTINTQGDEALWGKIKKSRGDYIVLAEMKDAETIQNEVFEYRNSDDEYDEYTRSWLGEIKKVEPNRHRLLVILDESFLNKRWDQEKQLPEIADIGMLDYTARGDRSNIKQQRSALEDLKIGKTANPRLNRFIFDAQEAAIADNEIMTIDRRDLLSQNLNADQKKAVEHALATPDLYLIQGPPGTGKTTVIAELCYQFTKQGKRVLLASQANLAVDNALSRLAHSPNILALRMGNINSIEDEGAVFVEDNVVKRWFRETLRDHRIYGQNFTSRAEKFGFVATNRNGMVRLVEKLTTIDPVSKSL